MVMCPTRHSFEAVSGGAMVRPRRPVIGLKTKLAKKNKEKTYWVSRRMAQGATAKGMCCVT